MMIYISFCVRDKTDIFTCVAINVLWRTSAISTFTVFVKILLIQISKIYIKKTVVFIAHFGTSAAPISMLPYPNHSLCLSCFYNLPSRQETSKVTRLLDLTLNITVPFISAGTQWTYCTEIFAQKSRVYLSCFGGKVFPDADEWQSGSLPDLSLRLSSRQSTFVPII